MSQDSHQLNFRQKFLEELYAIQEYLNFRGSTHSKHFMEDVFDFIVDNIGNNPYLAPECYFLKTTTKSYRRAIFKKEYAIIYKVGENTIDILTIYHTSRDSSQIMIE